MNTNTNEKEKLQTRLNAILKKEKQQRIAENYPAVKKQYEGKFFKYRNSWGGDGRKWWIYRKVLEIKRNDVYEIRDGEATAHVRVYQFEEMPNGEVLIGKNYPTYAHSLGEPISETEYNNAWNKMISNL